MQHSVIKMALLLCPAVLMSALSMDIYVPSVPRMMDMLHTSQTKVQVTLSIFLMGTSIGQLIAGPMADHWGRKILAQWSVLVYIFATLLCANAPTIEVLILGRTLQAFSSCSAMVCAYAMVRDTFSHDDAPRVYSYISACVGLAPIVAPIIGGYLLAWTGSWRSGFIFLVFWGLGVLAVILGAWQETLPDRKHLGMEAGNIFQRYWTLFRHREFMTFTYIASVGLMALFIFFSVAPILLIKELGVKEEHFGFYFALSAMVFLVVSLITPNIRQRFGTYRTTLAACVFTVLGALAMMGWHQVWGLTPYGVVLPTFILYIGAGLMFGPSAGAAMKPFPNMAGTAAALFGCLQFGIPAILGTIVMLLPVNSTWSIAVPMGLMGTLGGLILGWQMIRNPELKRV